MLVSVAMLIYMIDRYMPRDIPAFLIHVAAYSKCKKRFDGNRRSFGVLIKMSVQAKVIIETL